MKIVKAGQVGDIFSRYLYTTLRGCYKEIFSFLGGGLGESIWNALYFRNNQAKSKSYLLWEFM